MDQLSQATRVSPDSLKLSLKEREKGRTQQLSTVIYWDGKMNCELLFRLEEVCSGRNLNSAKWGDTFNPFTARPCVWYELFLDWLRRLELISNTLTLTEQSPSQPVDVALTV